MRSGAIQLRLNRSRRPDTDKRCFPHQLAAHVAAQVGTCTGTTSLHMRIRPQELRSLTGKGTSVVVSRPGVAQDCICASDVRGRTRRGAQGRWERAPRIGGYIVLGLLAFLAFAAQALAACAASFELRRPRTTHAVRQAQTLSGPEQIQNGNCCAPSGKSKLFIPGLLDLRVTDCGFRRSPGKPQFEGRIAVSGVLISEAHDSL